MKPRAAWPVLVKKAKEKCDEATAALVKGRERVAQMEQRRARMAQLYQDYVQRSRDAERKSHRMAETLNFRGFMQQLQDLIMRVDLDLQHARHEVDVLKQALRAAEHKRIQMETLMEQDLKRVREHAMRREQREMDAAGVMLYNLRP